MSEITLGIAESCDTFIENRGYKKFTSYYMEPHIYVVFAQEDLTEDLTDEYSLFFCFAKEAEEEDTVVTHRMVQRATKYLEHYCFGTPTLINSVNSLTMFMISKDKAFVRYCTNVDMESSHNHNDVQQEIEISNSLAALDRVQVRNIEWVLKYNSMNPICCCEIGTKSLVLAEKPYSKNKGNKLCLIVAYPMNESAKAKDSEIFKPLEEMLKYYKVSHTNAVIRDDKIDIMTVGISNKDNKIVLTVDNDPLVEP